MEEKIQVLFVCLGNICRSPMAEGLFLHHVKQAGLEDRIQVDSAGTSGWHIGELADPRMRETAARHGVELVSRARQLMPEDFAEFDYILVMDRSNYTDARRIEAQASASKAKLHLMMEFDPEATKEEVPDPYYGGRQGFEQVYQMLDRASAGLLQEIRQGL